MAIDAPTHVKRVLLPGDRHLIDGAMAGGAADAFRHVDAVVEENEVRSLIDAFPVQRLSSR